MQQEYKTTREIKETTRKKVTKKKMLKIWEKHKKIYKQKVQKVFIKLFKKYFEFLKLFIKKDYQLL